MNKEQQIKEWFNNYYNKKNIKTIPYKNNYYLYIYEYFEKLQIDYKSKTARVKYLLTNILEVISIIKVKENTNFIKDLENILILKNQKYGDSFDKTLNRYGIVALIIRLEDKINRLKNILESKQPDDEDTLLDIAGYCVLGLMYLQ